MALLNMQSMPFLWQMAGKDTCSFHHLHLWPGALADHNTTACCLCRILWAFKLNPFEKLNLRFDATYEDIRKAYRRISLAVHPDKCKHPQAAAAFESECICTHSLS